MFQQHPSKHIHIRTLPSRMLSGRFVSQFALDAGCSSTLFSLHRHFVARTPCWHILILVWRKSARGSYYTTVLAISSKLTLTYLFPTPSKIGDIMGRRISACIRPSDYPRSAHL